jgi:hypothetical protein
MLPTLGEYTYGNMCHYDRNDACPSLYIHVIWEFKLGNMIMELKHMVLSKFDSDRKERST